MRNGFKELKKAVAALNGTEVFTERLQLRCPVAADATAIIGILADWDVARSLGRIPYPYTRADFSFFMEQVVPHEPTWAIVRRSNGVLVGVIGLAPHGESRSAELGYYLGRQHWGQGLATEAAQAVVRMVLETGVYATIRAGYFVENPASGRVLAKLGFKASGGSNRPCLAEGRDKPSIEVELPAWGSLDHQGNTPLRSG